MLSKNNPSSKERNWNGRKGKEKEGISLQFFSYKFGTPHCLNRLRLYNAQVNLRHNRQLAAKILKLSITNRFVTW